MSISNCRTSWLCGGRIEAFGVVPHERNDERLCHHHSRMLLLDANSRLLFAHKLAINTQHTLLSSISSVSKNPFCSKSPIPLTFRDKKSQVNTSMNCIDSKVNNYAGKNRKTVRIAPGPQVLNYVEKMGQISDQESRTLSQMVATRRTMHPFSSRSTSCRGYWNGSESSLPRLER